MRQFTRKDIDALETLYRINLINSCSGYKSANLLASISPEGIPNVAIFSSVTHLGSNPPLLGFVLRPTTVPRHTFRNIKEQKFFSINHVSQNSIVDAHHTSAKYGEDISEFDKTGLTIEYKDGLSVPFVKDAPVQLLMKYVEEHSITNGTLMLVSQVEVLFVKDYLLAEDGFIDLSKGNVVTINGLDGYNATKLINRFAYARPEQKTKTL